MTWVGTFILDERGQPVPCQTLEWAQWFDGPIDLRRVALTDLGERGSISTIFLGLDHNFNPMQDPLTYRPILWETMVFGGPQDKNMRRYWSREAAERGHEEMVALCMEAKVNG